MLAAITGPFKAGEGFFTAMRGTKKPIIGSNTAYT